MPNPQRYLCIHGHFYQPPRENPWLEVVEIQPSAAPYHDWNERITAECYAPNGASRLLNPENEIIRIVNNYSRMSFNFGPTLLSWLESEAPRTCRSILEADQMSQSRFGGHGSAMAQGYNHMILPLANRRDKITQIEWGLADFASRFGRQAEGMWLPEAAVDSESLDLMAERGLKFVVLSPGQCKRVRPIASPEVNPAVNPDANPVPNSNANAGANSEQAGTPPTDTAAWFSTPNNSVNPMRAYRLTLPSGRTIAAFFYHGGCSQAIAFEGLLNKGEYFYDRLINSFDPRSNEPQLIHVATDGESYGHHHRYGDMALAWMLEHVEQTGEVKLTNYGQFLEMFPPQWEAEIVENSSWSCAHGIERWRSNCGCNTHPGWSQQWRGPLRTSLDWLRDTIAPYAQRLAESFHFDLDRARNAYIDVILHRDHDPECALAPAAAKFLDEFAPQAMSLEEKQQVLKLMEMERHAQLMYTSCGWFFDEISGIETVQVMAYASRALQLAQMLFSKELAEAFPDGLEPALIERLTAAQSNLPAEGNGAQVYRSHILPMKVDLEQVATHYAISSIFTTYPEDANLLCYTAHRSAYDKFSSGRASLIVGRVLIRSKTTLASANFAFTVLHLGDHNLTAAVKPWNSERDGSHEALCAALRAAIGRADLAGVIRVIDQRFGKINDEGQQQPARTYSLTSLFQDEQRRILDLILKSTLAEVEASISTIYETQASLLHFLSESQLPKPQALLLAANFAVNTSLRRALECDPVDIAQVRTLLATADSDKIELDRQTLSYLAGTRMKESMMRLLEHAENGEYLEDALTLARTLDLFPFETRIWKAQNIWNEILKTTHTRNLPPEWTELFLELGRKLHICADCLWTDRP